MLERQQQAALGLRALATSERRQMATFPSMNGKYYRTSMDDIKGSEGWFRKLLLLGLINFVPVFGQMTLYGYAYEWAQKAAWGVQSPMPEKIYGRPGSKMLRWGWFALVISIVMNIIPCIVSWISGGLYGMSASTLGNSSMYLHHSYDGMMSAASAASGMAGGLLSVLSVVLFFAAAFFFWVGAIRMAIYDRLGSGLQFGQIWKMMRHDVGGLFRIFGMNLLVALIGGVVLTLVAMVFLGIFGIGAILTGIAAYSDYGYYGSGAAAMLVTMLLSIFPLFLVFLYACSVFQAFLEILTARAVGYWARQFDVARWGKDTDPLPFESEPAPQTPQQPVAPQVTGATVSGTAAPQTPEGAAQQQTGTPAEPAAEPAGQEAAAAEPAEQQAAAAVEPAAEPATAAGAAAAAEPATAAEPAEPAEQAADDAKPAAVDEGAAKPAEGGENGK